MKKALAVVFGLMLVAGISCAAYAQDDVQGDEPVVVEEMDVIEIEEVTGDATTAAADIK